MPPTKQKYMSESLNNYIVVQPELEEEIKSSGGIIINIPKAFDFGEMFSKKNTITAKVIYANKSVPFLKEGDRIVVNPTKGVKATIDMEDMTIISKDQFIAKIDESGKFIVPPDSVMVRIKKEDTDSLYSKWIVKDDGTKVQLFIQPEPDKHSDKRSKVFVSLGEVAQAGSNVSWINEGDIALLDYTVDNFTDNILYYDDDDNKYVVIDGVTTFHKHDTWAYGNRVNPKDTLVSKAGDMDVISPLLGVVRDGELIANFPYVFLEHRSNIVEKISQSGIIFSDMEFIAKRKIIAASERSGVKYGVKKGQFIVVSEFDIFDVKLKDGMIQCTLDADILMNLKRGI